MKKTLRKIVLVYRQIAELIDHKTFEWIGKPWVWFIVGILFIVTGVWLFGVGGDSALEGTSDQDRAQGFGLLLMIFGVSAMIGIVRSFFRRQRHR